jgi:hypothetical protein
VQAARAHEPHHLFVRNDARLMHLNIAGQQLGAATAIADQQLAVTILGATAELLKQTGVPDANRAGHFTQFAELEPEQVQGDDETVCATVRRLAPTLTPDTNR